jgi:negative regulator of flagellin synthesis FlgM
MTRIDGLNPLATSRTGAGGPSQGADGLGGEGSGVDRLEGRQDGISLSSRGRVVAVAAQAVAQSADVRAERIAALKAAIADGSYSSDARGIAQRLLPGLAEG